MLSKTVVNFLYALLASDNGIHEIISDIGYGERFVVVVDFDIMHKVMMSENYYIPKEEDDLISNTKLWTDFIKKLLTNEQSLEMIAKSYEVKQRYYIANILCNMKNMLLKGIKNYIDFGDELLCSGQKINH